MAFSAHGAQQTRQLLGVIDLTGDGDVFDDSSFYEVQPPLEVQEIQRNKEEEARVQLELKEIQRHEYQLACAVRRYDQVDRKRYFSHSIFETPSRTITSGALSRTHPNHTKPFNFLRLIPAEIRNTIYACLLEAGGLLHVNEHDHRPTVSIACLSSPAGQHAGARVEERQLNRLAIARVSKQISGEVSPITYGKNEFAFDRADTLADFLKMIGKNAEYLHKIIVPGARAWDLNISVLRFENLALATSLTSLKINHEGMYLHALSGAAKISVSDLLSQIKSFLHARHAASRGTRNADSVLDVVEIAEIEVCDHCDRLPEQCKQRASCKQAFATKRGKVHLENVSAKLKKAIAMELGIGFEGD